MLKNAEAPSTNMKEHICTDTPIIRFFNTGLEGGKGANSRPRVPSPSPCLSAAARV